mgnify:FL=1
MQRPHSIDPQVFLEVLQLAGCRLGPIGGVVRSVHNPEGEGYWAIVRMGEPTITRTIEAHLRNLHISEERFLRWFAHYASR